MKSMAAWREHQEKYSAIFPVYEERTSSSGFVDRNTPMYCTSHRAIGSSSGCGNGALENYSFHLECFNREDIPIELIEDGYR